MATKPFRKGMKRAPGAGRRKGIPNKTTVAVKTAIQMAFQGMGGWKGLLKWGKRNPDLFYTKVWIRLCPHNVNLDTSEISEVAAKIQEAVGLATEDQLRDLEKLVKQMKDAQAQKNQTQTSRTLH